VLDGESDRDTAMGLGARDFILKPFQLEDLILRLRSVLDDDSTAPDLGR